MSITLAIDFGSKNIGLALVRNHDDGQNEALFAGTIQYDAFLLKQKVAPRAQIRRARRTRKTKKTRLRKLEHGLLTVGVPPDVVPSLVGFCRRRGYKSLWDEEPETEQQAQEKEEEILYRFKREDFFVALEHELERRLPEHLRQPALTLDTHHQVSVKNSRHAAYILVHMIKDLAHEFVIHPPAGMSEEEFVEEMVELVGRYLGRGKRYEV